MSSFILTQIQGSFFLSALRSLNHNTIVPTKLDTIGKLYGIIRQTSRLTHLDLKLRKESLICICSNILIAKVNTKPIVIHIFSENISSTRNSIQRNIKSSIKIEANQSAQL